MKIYINDEEIDFTLETEKTVGDILNAIEAELEANNSTITAIAIDDELLSIDEIDNAELIPISKISSLNLSCVSQEDIYTTLKQLCNHFAEMLESIKNISVLLQSGQDNEAKTIITNFADSFALLCRTITLSSLFPDRFVALKINGLSLAEFLADFSPVLKDLENALITYDTVLIGDLSEYEITPRLNLLINFGLTL